nr:ATP-binding protein [uncultured Shuttleworthia sp.]
MYYTEIAKIIEAGMRKDPIKVASYSRLLAKKMSDDGEKRGSNRILSVLDKMGSGQAVMDTLTTMPVDQESRLDIAEIDYAPRVNNIILSKPVQDMLDDFKDTIKSKNKMMSMGLEFRTSLLLYGSPGCGKTSAAKYLASELKLPLITARFDTLISSLLGNTAKNIHRIFEYAKKQPCILFLDEFDAIAKARDDSHELGELKRVVNSLLQNIDDFAQEGILIAATNHSGMLDTAVWRRFQTIIELPQPGIDEIRRFINQFPNVADASGITESQWKSIFKAMDDLSYSDIKDIIQNMLKKSVLQKKKEIGIIDYLMEIFLFRNHGNYSQEELVKYLSDKGAPQKMIAKALSVSDRTVRNYLGKGVSK